MKKQVLFIFGGKSDEHEISLISAKCILEALDRTMYSPILVGISRDGVWYLEDEKTFCTGGFKANEIKLNTDAPRITISPSSTRDRKGHLFAEGKEYTCDVVFPILHGPFGEDGTIQGLFETMGVPYVGSGPSSSSICMDKALSKKLCRFHGINVSDFVVIENASELDHLKTKIEKLGFPLFVKPSRLGSSVGISKVNSQGEIKSAVETALKLDNTCLIEKGIKGREIETAVLGLNHNAKVAVPGEVIPNPKIGWYTYEAKYLQEDGAVLVVPADLTHQESTAIQKLSLEVFHVLQCSGMARIDLFLEERTGAIYLNEANTIPGFTPISMYPKMWQASGLSYQALISELLQQASIKLRP